MERRSPFPAEATDASGDEHARHVRARPAIVALAVTLAIAAAVGITWPEIADELHARGISHPDRVIELIGCVVLGAAAALLLVGARQETGRRSVALGLVAAGAAIVATSTSAMAIGGSHTVGMVTTTGPTTWQIVGMATLVAAICAVPSAVRWNAVLAIDAGLGTVAAISFTWLAPVRTSTGAGGGLADVVGREPTAAVLISLMVAGVVLLVRVIQRPRSGDLALVVAALLVPSALYVSLVGQFAGHAALALRTSTLWWMTGPEMLLVAGWQVARVRSDGAAPTRRPSEPSSGTDDIEEDGAGSGEGVAVAATLLTLSAVATHRLFIDSLDPVMLALGVVAVLLSITRLALLQREQSRLQERLGMLATRLHRRARTDELTGLGNRVALAELLAREHVSDRPIAAFYADVDEFKAVNDALGHDVGDKLLAGVANRLVSVFGADVHRVGGDEFVAVCRDLTAARAEEMAVLAVEACREPLEVDPGVVVPARISIGAAVEAGTGSDDMEDPDRSEDAVVRMADLALNRAKELGRGCAVMYDDWLRDRADRRAVATRGLRSAVERAELEVRYRPIVDLVDGRVTAAEAVIRWKTPDDRMLVPEEYLEIAGDTGLVPALSRLGLKLAAAPWQGSGANRLELVVSATLQELVHVGYLDDLMESVGDLDVTCLRVQVPEAVLMDPAVVPTVDRLVSERVPICVREFGSAASSVRRLRRMHDPSIRIDRSFVAGLEDRRADGVIVEAVTALGAQLGVAVVADGVTRPGQVNRLRDIGVEQAQGWLFGPPTSWSSFVERHLDADRRPSGLVWNPNPQRAELTGGPRP